MSPGIKCGHCLGRHRTVAQVRLCAHRQAQLAAQELEQERTFELEIQAREREEDERVARFKADRDERLLAGFSRTRRQRPW